MAGLCLSLLNDQEQPRMGTVRARHLLWHRPPAKRAARVAGMAQRGVINAASYRQKKEKIKNSESL